MQVPILQQGAFLIAQIQAALSDDAMTHLREDIIELIGVRRAKGVIIDVAALDVLDSFGTRTLRGIAIATRLRGAEPVIVGIQPDVAFAMVQLGLTLDGIPTALDLEEGLAYLQQRARNRIRALGRDRG